MCDHKMEAADPEEERPPLVVSITPGRLLVNHNVIHEN